MKMARLGTGYISRYLLPGWASGAWLHHKSYGPSLHTISGVLTTMQRPVQGSPWHTKAQQRRNWQKVPTHSWTRMTTESKTEFQRFRKMQFKFKWTGIQNSRYLHNMLWSSAAGFFIWPLGHRLCPFLAATSLDHRGTLAHRNKQKHIVQTCRRTQNAVPGVQKSPKTVQDMQKSPKTSSGSPEESTNL